VTHGSSEAKAPLLAARPGEGVLPGQQLRALCLETELGKRSVATGAMYGTGTTRRQEGAKADAAKRKRDAGPDILIPQNRALEAMDEALDTDHNMNHSTEGQEAWRMNIALMHR